MNGEGQPSPDFEAELKYSRVTEQQIIKILADDSRLISYLASRMGITTNDYDDIRNELAMRIIMQFRDPLISTDWDKFVSPNSAFRTGIYKRKIIDYLRSAKTRNRNEIVTDTFDDKKTENINYRDIETKNDLSKMLDLLSARIKKEKKRRMFMYIIKSFLDGKNLTETQESMKSELGIDLTEQRISQIYIECSEQIRKDTPHFPANLQDLRKFFSNDDTKLLQDSEARKDQYMVPIIIEKRKEIIEKLGRQDIGEKEKNKLRRNLLLIDYYILTDEPKKITEIGSTSNLPRLLEQISYEIFGDEHYINRNRKIIRMAYSLRAQKQTQKNIDK